MKSNLEKCRDMLRDIESMSSNAEEFLTISDIRSKLMEIMIQTKYDIERIENFQ